MPLSPSCSCALLPRWDGKLRLQQNSKHLQSFLDLMHFMAGERLSIPCVSCWPPLHLPRAEAHRGLTTGCAGPAQAFISIHHRLPSQTLCFTFGCCTGASLMLGWLFSSMECPHGPCSRWRQFHGLSLAGQEPCLGSLLLPRTISLQTGVVSSYSDFGMLLVLAKFSTEQQEEHKAHFISIFPESSFFLQCF